MRTAPLSPNGTEDTRKETRNDGLAGPKKPFVSKNPNHIVHTYLQAAFVEALNPQQAQPQAPIGKHPGADRLQRTVDGRALLPEYQSGDEKNVVQILQALILCAWSEVILVMMRFSR